MRTTLMVAALAVSMGPFGAMPHEWAQSARLYHAARIGDADYLAEILGCTLDEPMEGLRSMQCGETFLFVGERGATALALGNISNIQAAGHIREARVFQGGAGTIDRGRIDRAIVLEADCYGDVGECIAVRGQSIQLGGWTLRAVGDGLELIGPDGTLRDNW